MTRPLDGGWLGVAVCLAGGTNRRKAIVALMAEPGVARKHTARKVWSALQAMVDVGLVRHHEDDGYDLTDEGVRQVEEAEDGAD